MMFGKRGRGVDVYRGSGGLGCVYISGLERSDRGGEGGGGREWVGCLYCVWSQPRGFADERERERKKEGEREKKREKERERAQLREGQAE